MSNNIHFVMCNIINNTMVDNNNLYVRPTIIFYQIRNCIINNFTFIRNDFGKFGMIASVDYETRNIIFINCVASFCPIQAWKAYHITTIDCIIDDKDFETIDLNLHNMVDCKNAFPTENFSDSLDFTQSFAFSDGIYSFLRFYSFTFYWSNQFFHSIEYIHSIIWLYSFKILFILILASLHKFRSFYAFFILLKFWPFYKFKFVDRNKVFVTFHNVVNFVKFFCVFKFVSSFQKTVVIKYVELFLFVLERNTLVFFFFSFSFFIFLYFIKCVFVDVCRRTWWLLLYTGSFSCWKKCPLYISILFTNIG